MPLFTNDTFTDTTGTLLENHTGSTGATWTKNPAFSTGSAVITNANRIRGGATNGIYYASGTPASADYDVEADLFVASVAGAAGLLGRENTAAGTYYLLDYETGSTAWKLYAIVNGSTAASTSFSQTLTVGQTYHVRLAMRGSSITGYVNGTAVVSLTDSNITAAGKAGVYFGQADTDSTGFHLDTLTAATPNVITPSDTNLLLSPYNWFTDGVGAMQSNNARASSTLARSNTPGAYAKLNFTASSAGYATLLLDTSSLSGITAANCPTLLVSLDGQAFTTPLLAYATGTTRLTISTNLSPGSHTLSIIFRGVNLSSTSSMGDRWTTPASCVTITGIELDGKGSASAAPTIRSKRLLVYGDSITEGADAVGSANANADQDASQTYAQLLGVALNAEVGIVGFSAQGYTVAGYGNIPKLYDTATPSNSSFDKFYAGITRLISGKLSPAPDFIAILMGKNDVGSSDASVTNSVSALITAIRTAAPLAQIFVIIPFDGTKRSAVSAGVTNANDPNTHLIDLGTNIQPTLATGGVYTNDSIHPNVRGHAQFSALLASSLQSTLNSPGPISTSTGYFAGGSVLLTAGVFQT